MIETDETSAQVAQRIDHNSNFAQSKDLLLVVNLTQKGFTALGQVKDGDLHGLMSRR